MLRSRSCRRVREIARPTRSASRRRTSTVSSSKSRGVSTPTWTLPRTRPRSTSGTARTDATAGPSELASMSLAARSRIVSGARSRMTRAATPSTRTSPLRCTVTSSPGDAEALKGSPSPVSTIAARSTSSASSSRASSSASRSSRPSAASAASAIDCMTRSRSAVTSAFARAACARTSWSCSRSARRRSRRSWTWRMRSACEPSRGRASDAVTQTGIDVPAGPVSVRSTS